MRNFLIVILSMANALLNSAIFLNGHMDCGTFVQSACADSMTTKWNRYNIGHTLKDWIKSIAKLRYLPKEYKKLIFTRKTVAIFDERGSFSNGNSEGGNDVILINNKKCSEEKNHGPTWRKASNYSGCQFSDGFLYGHEDSNGELTGVYAYVL